MVPRGQSGEARKKHRDLLWGYGFVGVWVIGFLLFGKAARPRIDLGAHLLAAPSPKTR